MKFERLLAQVNAKLGKKLKFLMGKPGLDGHSNGAEQIATRARDCGMEISYEGIRLTPDEIITAVQDGEALHVIGSVYFVGFTYRINARFND